ncbi:uncharacterized protein METZ01_LOCUS220023 [marine metagenome]|uniref:Uncharacterized protein n=1 Tax=marine metagenome TaxID=408172 RepID=A0A382FX22_9ZZZZ
MNHQYQNRRRRRSRENYPERSGGRSGLSSDHPNLAEDQYYRNDSSSKINHPSSSTTVAAAGIITLIATNFKAEVRLIIEKFFGLLGG